LKELQNFPEYQFSTLGKYKFAQRMLNNFSYEKKYIIESQKRKASLLARDFGIVPID